MILSVQWPLLSVLICSKLTSAVIINFELPTAGDQNDLLLKCVSPTAEVIDGALIEFKRTRSSLPHRTELLHASEGGVSFQVTPENEALLRCRANGEFSSVVAIAAVPIIHPERRVNVSVFKNEEVTLRCPIPLGNLYRELDPYELSWVIVGTPPEPVDSSQYSDSNRNLKVWVNDTTCSNLYACMLRLRRCNVPGRCVDEMLYSGPTTSFDVFEISRVLSAPLNQTAQAGQEVTFVCEGSGSFINITWEYGGLCEGISDRRLCGDAVSITTAASSGDERNQTLTSNLTIDTSWLQVENGDNRQHQVHCVLHQEVPGRAVQDKISPATVMVVTDETPAPSSSATDGILPKPNRSGLPLGILCEIFIVSLIISL